MQKTIPKSRHIVLVSLVASIGLFLSLLLQSTPIESSSLSSTNSNMMQEFQDALDPAFLPTIAAQTWERITIQDGDSLSGIFNRLGLSSEQLQRVINLEDWKKIITRLRPGQRIDLMIDPDSRQLQALRYWLDQASYLLTAYTGRGFESQVVERPVTTRLAFTEAKINHSMFLAGQAAGLSDRLIMQIIDLFAWDIDFAMDVGRGDSYRVLFERKYVDNDFVGVGDIVAVEFNTRTKQHHAVAHTHSNGQKQFYTPEGLSLRKPFIRNPVDYTKISSGFSDSRNHPVLHTQRAHKGVDYAAPTGTPVHAVGDGRIVRMQYDESGYGYYIELQHGIQYTTLYAHFSAFADGISEGTMIRQGDVIGYVGESGLATGPHLHFEFRVNGEHKDPLTVDLPSSDPLTGKEKIIFLNNAAALLNKMAYPREMAIEVNVV